MDLEITKKNGAKYRLSDYGIVKDIIVESPEVILRRRQVPGRPGAIDYGMDYGDKRIKVEFKFKHEHNIDYANLRDELYGFLLDEDSYFIQEKRSKDEWRYEFVDFGKAPINNYGLVGQNVSGYGWHVRLENAITPEQVVKGGEIELVFVTAGLPFGETTYTTMDLHRTGYDENLGVYGTADNIDFDYTKYSFTTSTFKIWNAGNVAVQPETMFLKFTVHGLNSDSNFTIRNKTTGQSFVLKRSASNVSLTINGLDVRLNLTNVFRDTGMSFLNIAPGFNEFEISNGTFKVIEIDFKFYYK